MKKSKSAQLAFLIMSIFLVELIGLLQAVFSEQLVKYNLDNQIQYTSEMLLNQFITSYSANENIQSGIKNFSYQNFDEGLIKLYKSLKETTAFQKKGQERAYIGEDSLYQVEIKENTKQNRHFYSEDLGLDVDGIKSYKILSYEMKQEDRVLVGRRILVGLSDDRKWIISVEINQKEITTRMERTNRTMASILNSAYYFNERTGNFYVFAARGQVLYQGGLEKNATYFKNIDLNSGKRIGRLLRQERSSYQRIIYQKENEIKRSIIRTIYDEKLNVYFVYEMDQDKIFGKVEERLKMTWIIGLSVMTATFSGLFLIYYHRRSKGGGSQ
jgi:hypothetical protein